MSHISTLFFSHTKSFLCCLSSIYFVGRSAIYIMLLSFIVLFIASCAGASQYSQGESATKEVLAENATDNITEADKSNIKEDFMSIAPYAKEGYYYQVAAYRGEMSQDILAQIEKYPYIVYVSEQDSKPMYHYLIGAYDTIESMSVDKKAIYTLTKNTHIQKNMKPVVCYVNKNNELAGVRPNGTLSSSVIMATEVRFGKIASAMQESEIYKDDEAGALANAINTDEMQEDKILVNAETTDEAYLAAQAQDSQNLQELQENVALVLTQDTNFNDERCASVCAAQNSE